MNPGNAASASRPTVSVIVPARNEEANLERCLLSLVLQRGLSFELIVIDDHSTDSTAEITRKFAEVKRCPIAGADADLLRVVVLEARSPLPEGWTGKANALWTGVQHAEGDWFLFTDADTEHAPDSLAAVVAEAESARIDLLSLSPEQEVNGFWERALMPIIFAELATTYRPKDVCDPANPAAAANGQYLLIRRSVYEEAGGHSSVAGDLLEDVALARKVKSAGRTIRLRLGKGLVRTRMYRGLRQLCDGWTKNLCLLFPNARRLAYRRTIEFIALTAIPLASLAAFLAGNGFWASLALAVGIVFWIQFLRRICRAHFDALSTTLSVFGLPLFAILLGRSEVAHRDGRVQWKGRNYSDLNAAAQEQMSSPASRNRSAH